MKQLLSEVRIEEIKLSDALLFFPLSSHCPYLSLLLPLVAQLRLILFLSECTDTEKLYLGRFSVFPYYRRHEKSLNVKSSNKKVLN